MLNTPRSNDAEFHGIYISFKLISYVFCVSDVCRYNYVVYHINGDLYIT